jgi:hypothetical protein
MVANRLSKRPWVNTSDSPATRQPPATRIDSNIARTLQDIAEQAAALKAWAMQEKMKHRHYLINCLPITIGPSLCRDLVAIPC